MGLRPTSSTVSLKLNYLAWVSVKQWLHHVISLRRALLAWARPSFAQTHTIPRLGEDPHLTLTSYEAQIRTRIRTRHEHGHGETSKLKKCRTRTRWYIYIYIYILLVQRSINTEFTDSKKDECSTYAFPFLHVGIWSTSHFQSLNPTSHTLNEE